MMASISEKSTASKFSTTVREIMTALRESTSMNEIPMASME